MVNGFYGALEISKLVDAIETLVTQVRLLMTQNDVPRHRQGALLTDWRGRPIAGLLINKLWKKTGAG